MARIYREIRVDGRNLLALFDTGSRHSYVRRASLPPSVQPRRLRESRITRFGGRVHTVEAECYLAGDLDDIEVTLHAYLVEDIGPAEELERAIDLLVGAPAMEMWGVRIDLSQEAPVLDLTLARRREFYEY